ncbi:MAG: alkaline phosphatase family protein [Saccharospirillum sp.]
MRNSRWVQVLITTLAVLGLFVALSLPNRLIWWDWPAFRFFPLELVVIGFLLLLPRVHGRVMLWVLSLLLGLSLVLRGADLVTHEMFARPFNLIFDGHLLADGSRLLTGVLGAASAWLVGLGLVLLVLLAGWLSYQLLGRIQRTLHAAPRISGVLLLALLVSWGGLRASGWDRADTFAWDQLVMHSRHTLYSLQDIQAFSESLNNQPPLAVPMEDLFAQLEGKDVYFVFAESYGRALLERDPFVEPVTAKLAWAEDALASEGVLMRSAFLTSPTVGGLSWLGHASVLAGVWVDSETRYKTLMLSDRPTLNRLFRDAGWRTVAAMPAISLAWPEGAYYGYDHIYNAHTFGYEGLPFNWVTMPDQYVWSALHERERTGGNRAPVMAELALISSHAPWTPIAELVPWDQVGDGQIFNDQAQAGPTPEQVWRNVESIRHHYRQSIEYMLDVLVSYLQEYGNDNLVMVVMGDHQAAPMITGDPDGRDVPVHLLASDPAVIEAINAWQWQPGLLPDANAPVWRMDQLYDRFIAAFSEQNGGTDR